MAISVVSRRIAAADAAGDKVKQYPNLANIPTGAWAAGVWNGKLYGLPVYPSAATFAGTGSRCGEP